MVQETAKKAAEKMSDHSVIESKATCIYAYGLELPYSSLAMVARNVYLRWHLRWSCLCPYSLFAHLQPTTDEDFRYFKTVLLVKDT